jgi:hypothetical protein
VVPNKHRIEHQLSFVDAGVVDGFDAASVEVEGAAAVAGFDVSLLVAGAALSSLPDEGGFSDPLAAGSPLFLA